MRQTSGTFHCLFVSGISVEINLYGIKSKIKLVKIEMVYFVSKIVLTEQFLKFLFVFEIETNNWNLETCRNKFRKCTNFLFLEWASEKDLTLYRYLATCYLLWWANVNWVWELLTS